MKKAFSVLGLALASGLAFAQETKPAAAPQAQATPPPVKPGPEHELLKADAGVWDATVEVMAAPGQPMSTSKGVETNNLVGGLWLVSDFKSEMMGAPFEGHGVMGWDTNKKKYVGTWVDSTSTGIWNSESTYDAATKTLTGALEGPDHAGAILKMKSVVAHPDPDTRVFTMSAPGPDGKDMATMKITYKRRK